MSVLLGSCGAQTADLEVTQTESADPVAPSSQMSYTAIVTNHGPFPATNVRLVHDATSTGANLIWQGAVVTPQGSCENVAGSASLICDLGTLAPGASATVQNLLQASGPGSIRSVFIATAAEVDLAPDNNRDAETTTVHEPAYIVTTPADAGAGSLRQAILDANAHPGPDTILFSIPGAAPHTIAPLSALPAITEALLIDAPTTGNCAGAAPTIEIDGVSAGATSGLVGTAAGITIRGLSITRFAQYGITLTDGGVVECSYLGVGPTGAARGNTLGGIRLTGSGNTIGGATSAVRNVISANAGYGVRIEGPGGNFVQGNFIGTNAAGTADLGNATEGVSIFQSPNNTVGGLTAIPGTGVGNVLSGNNTDGVRVEGHLNATGNVIQGNIIGLSADGTTDVGNLTGVRATNAGLQVGGVSGAARNIISGNSVGVVLSNSGSTFHSFIEGNYIGTDITGMLDRGNSLGVSVGSAPGTRVGGTGAGAGNVISGNQQTGILIFAGTHRAIGGVYNALVQGNLIGVNAAGTGPLGNGTGVRVQNNFNLIGGTDPGAANTIAYSLGTGSDPGHGVEVRFGIEAPILSNAIYANAGLGIDLNGDGPTANDPLDADAGANLGQNYPVITSARRTGADASVSGALRSTPATVLTIQVFANNTGEAAQGRRLLGTITETTDADGFATFALAPAIALGEIITATATDPAGNTSEFSPGVATVAGSAMPLSIDTTAFSTSPVYVVNEAGGAQAVAPTIAGGVIATALLPGSYTFRIPFASTTAAFDFLVASDGTLDFSPLLDGYVSGRGTAVLTVLGRTLTVDTTALQPKPPGWQASNFLVSGFVSNHVHRYDGQSGTFTDMFVDSEALDGPGGMAFGPDGNLYLVSQTNHSVVRTDGTLGGDATPFVTTGSGGLSFPTSLTFGPDGSLYVASLGTHQVLRYNGITGAFLGVFVSASSGGLDKPTDLEFGPDGHLYVLGNESQNVLRYNGSTGAFMDVFASGNGMTLPSALVFGPDGHLYVTSNNDSVLRFNGTTGAFIDAFVPTGSGGLNNPISLVFGPDGRLYVSSDNSVLRFNGTTGAFIDTFVASGAGGLNLPAALLFHAGVGLPSPPLYNITSDGGQAIQHTFAGGTNRLRCCPDIHRPRAVLVDDGGVRLRPRHAGPGRLPGHARRVRQRTRHQHAHHRRAADHVRHDPAQSIGRVCGRVGGRSGVQSNGGRRAHDCTALARQLPLPRAGFLGLGGLRLHGEGGRNG